MSKVTAKKPNNKAAQAISRGLGRWSTLWWALSCGYALLVTVLIFFPLSMDLNMIVLGTSLILLFLGWGYLYTWWRRDLKKAKVDLHDGWHDLFSIRR